MARGVRFSDQDSTVRRILSDIRSRKFAPVYLLCGEDPYFIDIIDRTLVEGVMPEEERAFNQTIVYGLDTDGGTVASYCLQLPMLGQHTLVVVREAQNLDRIEALEKYLASPSPTTILVICFKYTGKRKVDKRGKLYKACSTMGVFLETAFPYEYEIGPWLVGFVRDRGFRIDESVVGVLVNHMGTDLSRISRELDKLMVALPEGTVQITADDIERYIGISKKYNIFELQNAVAGGRLKEALTISDRLMSNPKDAPALLVVKTLYSAFRAIFTINYLGWRARVKHIPFPQSAELLSMLHTTERGLRDYTSWAQKWDNRKVFGILKILGEYDARSKGMDRGERTDAELVRELILKIYMQ